ncbi:MAG: aldo/keto reductase, partial [Dehalococcoidia bacterium]
MEFRNLGRSGLQVSVAGLGTNQLGGRLDDAESARLVHAALEAGVNLFDDADIYGGRGKSEVALGKALAGRRHEAVIVSKFGNPMGDGPMRAGGSRRYIMQAVEDSLRRLGTDYIDLYYQHVPDQRTPHEETVRAMQDLVAQGKVRYIATSNLAAWQIVD